MSPSNITTSGPERLAALLGIGSPADPVSEWGRDELGAVLRHQLAVRIGFDARDWPEAVDGSERGVRAATFREVLTDPHPSPVLLERVKRFAKGSRPADGGGSGGDSDSGGSLPSAVATVLYYAAIVAALSRCGRRITSLDDEAIRRGIGWTLAQDWLDPTMRTLLEEAVV